MKVQYFGDVNDYRKFALLRLLAREGRFKIGVVWMLTPDDDRADGNNRAYAEQPDKWRSFDLELFDGLKNVPAKPTIEDLKRVEREGLVPSAVFFNDVTPADKEDRAAWHANALKATTGADLTFFDPDNGLSIASCPKGRKHSEKYVFMDEVIDHYVTGRSTLIYQHFSRKPRKDYIKGISEQLSANLLNSKVWAFETAHAVFMLAAQPNHALRVEAIAQAVKQRWTPSFFKAVYP
jgi:hypothetical protein